MDWTQALTVIGVFIGGFLYIMNRMDSKFEAMNTRFNNLENRLTSMESEIKNTNQRITDLKTDINQRLSSIEAENKDISKRLSSIEGYLAPKKVFHFEEHYKDSHEDPKEN